LAHTTVADEKVKIDSIILDAQERIESLGKQCDRYRAVFDSARLIIGHELVKPLTSISGYIELLESELGDAAGNKGRRYFGKVREATARLNSLIDTFVQMLHVDGCGESGCSVEKIDLFELIDDIASQFSDSLVNVNNDVPADLGPLYLRGKFLEVVVENLVTNAVKHSDGRGEVRITAELRRERRGSSNQQLLLLRVQDQGSGIPEEELDKIFDPFYRVGDDSDATGLGLGLALVKSVVALINGDVHVKSKVGEGTTVTLCVPVPGKE